MSRTDEPMFPILGDPVIKAIPWAAIEPHDKQAQSNHGGQTLNRLAQRGGLDPTEAEAVMLDRSYPYRKVDAKEQARSRANLMKLVWQFEVNRAPKADDARPAG